MNTRTAGVLPLTALLAALAVAPACGDVAPEDSEVWEPEPPIVVPGSNGAPPDDAIVLFDGGDLDAWQHADGREAQWRVDGDWFEVTPGTGDLQTRNGFGDVQLHIEWASPREVEGDGQGRGNSGVFLQGLYEVQVLDSFQNRTYSNGQAGSLYKQHMPLVNATRPPGEWQSFDIIFRAPRFEASGTLKSPATVTVLHNGVLVQNHAELAGPTVYIGAPEYQAHPDKLPLKLQDHDNPVRFRNIWLREFDAGDDAN